MSTQHTPGEWAAVKDPCPTTNNRWLIEKRGNGWKTLIAEVYGDADHQGGKDWQGTREGNARFIIRACNAHAELLELAHEWVTHFEVRDGCNFCNARKQDHDDHYPHCPVLKAKNLIAKIK